MKIVGIKIVKTAIYCSVLIMTIFPQPSFSGQRELASEGEQVVLSIDDTYKCSDEVTINITTKSVGYFDAGADVIQNLSEVSRAILGFECSQITKIFLKGYTEDVEVFSADTGQDVDWALQSEPAPLERYALFFSLREPDFFNLGALYSLKKPFVALNGIEDSFQFQAYQKQLVRLSEFIDGDTGSFLEYLKSPGKDLGSFKTAKSHFESLLSAIEELKPELHDQYFTTYLANLQSLKQEYWASQTSDVLDDYSLSISDIVEKAKLKVSEAESPEFTEYFDLQIADVLNEEILVLKGELTDASLLEVSFAADFMAELPEEIEKEVFPGSAALLSILPDQVGILLDERREELFNLARETIEVSGAGYLDADVIMETGFSLSQEFEEAGFPEDGEALVGFTVEHIDSVLTSNITAFRAELAALALDDVSATSLQEQSLLYGELATQFPGYVEYRKLIDEKLIADRSSICESILTKAEVKPDLFEIEISLFDEIILLSNLTCDLFENEHTLVLFERADLDSKYELEIINSDESVVQFTLATAENLNILELISRTLDDEATTDSEQIQEELLKLVEPPPNGSPDANGVRECDRLAGDPMDANKLESGLNFESEDLDPDAFDRALDACIAAIEDDPTDSRQQFQLGRMLWLAGDMEGAGYYFDIASSQDYPPALHFKAELLLSNSDKQNDFVDALVMFKKAGDAGYKPASDMIKELNPDGIAFYKEISPPGGKDMVNAMPNVGGSQTIFGTTTTVRLVAVDVKSCFQTTATDFSCEFKKILRCSISSSFGNGFAANVMSNALRSDCNSIPYEFGDFRRTGINKWRML